MQPWSADISSIILQSQHVGARLSPPNTPIPPSRSSTHTLNAPRLHHAAQTQRPLPVPNQSSGGFFDADAGQNHMMGTIGGWGSAALSGRLARYRHATPATAAAATHDQWRQPPPYGHIDALQCMPSALADSHSHTSHPHPSHHALASAEPHAFRHSAAASASTANALPGRSAAANDTTAINLSGRNFAFLRSGVRASPGPSAEDARSREAGGHVTASPLSPENWHASGDSSSNHGQVEHLTHYSSASTTQLAAAARDRDEHDLSRDHDDAAEAAAQEQALHVFRRQVVSNEMELLRQRLAIAHLELHSRNKDYELLQRAVAVTDHRAATAERALADLQHQVQASTDSARRPLQLEASTNTPLEIHAPPGDDGSAGSFGGVKGGSGGAAADASTQTVGADKESKYFALLQELTHSPPGGTSVSPQKHASPKVGMSLQHVNAKADHLAGKLEELLFNMSVQQREFSKLSRTSSNLFRTLVQSLQAIEHCYSILSGGHGEQCRRRRWVLAWLHAPAAAAASGLCDDDALVAFAGCDM